MFSPVTRRRSVTASRKGFADSLRLLLTALFWLPPQQCFRFRVPECLIYFLFFSLPPPAFHWVSSTVSPFSHTVPPADAAHITQPHGDWLKAVQRSSESGTIPKPTSITPGGFFGGVSVQRLQRSSQRTCFFLFLCCQPAHIQHLRANNSTQGGGKVEKETQKRPFYRQTVGIKEEDKAFPLGNDADVSLLRWLFSYGNT